VRLLTPPKPLRPDQYSPDATPQATEMAPGQRRAPVLQGTEDIMALPVQKKPAASVAENDTGTATTQNGEAGSAVKKTAPAATTSTTSTSVTRTAPSASGSVRATGVTSANGGSAPASTGFVPRPVKPANGSTSLGAATASSAGVTPKTKVIVDGPISNRSSDSSQITAPARSQTVAPVKKGPEIVPDDGSRPPSATKPAAPKPKPAIQPAGENAQPAPATPPNGDR
jgi:rod shape-determining protein MreC